MARHLSNAHVKTWNRMKKGSFIDKLGMVNILDAITHIEIRKTIKYKIAKLTMCET
jgi:hypothetical protein